MNCSSRPPVMPAPHNLKLIKDKKKTPRRTKIIDRETDRETERQRDRQTDRRKKEIQKIYIQYRI